MFIGISSKVYTLQKLSVHTFSKCTHLLTLCGYVNLAKSGFKLDIAVAILLNNSVDFILSTMPNIINSGFSNSGPIVVDFSDDLRKVMLLGSTYSVKEINKICSRSINEALLRGRTIVRKEVKQVYTIAQRGFDGRIDIDRATSFPRRGKVLQNTFLTGGIIASTKPLPMDLFTVSFNPSSQSKSTITKRGKVKVSNQKKARNFGGGVIIEAVRGNKEIIPFAFMLINNKAKVFARGKYNPGNGSYGFVQRHHRQENAQGNDSVTSMLSVTVHAAAINRKVQVQVADKLMTVFPEIFERQLNAQFNNAFQGIF